jgi:formamidase
MLQQSLSFTCVLIVDLTTDATAADNTQNRWHPDSTNCPSEPSPSSWSNLQPVPVAGTIKNGETVKIECVDWTGGQIKNNDSADDVRDVDLTKIHYLTGPFEIETAEPGDVLIVDIQDVQPLEDHPWGFTGIFAKKNGGEKDDPSSFAHPCYWH